jgi:hypothetical protein
MEFMLLVLLVWALYKLDKIIYLLQDERNEETDSEESHDEDR